MQDTRAALIQPPRLVGSLPSLGRIVDVDVLVSETLLSSRHHSNLSFFYIFFRFSHPLVL
ncbi:hypothetical protein GXM_01397 [Nostoc sphaeroides CCNUC1]|uniref:Uncharacterized protein n=1 Tax=Nostoc sphaeroides CCNUC1 TaxID=2653204 RepID=A0A5P8VU99_9NOSO|nr:hypothetical protein GXM_01397 [Nostoc sphaeroides CCNUC1]